MSILEAPRNDNYIFVNYKIGKNAHVSEVQPGIIYIEPNHTWTGMYKSIILKENEELRDMRRVAELSKINYFYFRDTNLDIGFSSRIGTNLKNIIIHTNKDVHITLSNPTRSSLRNLDLTCREFSLTKLANSPDINFIDVNINCNTIVLNEFSNYNTIVVGGSSKINARNAILKKPVTFDKPRDMRGYGYGFVQGVQRIFVHVSKSFGVLISSTPDIPEQQAIGATKTIDGKYCTECRASSETYRWISGD